MCAKILHYSIIVISEGLGSAETLDVFLGIPSMCIHKYCYLRETDSKNIDDYILPGSKKTPEPSMRVKNTNIVRL